MPGIAAVEQRLRIYVPLSTAVIIASRRRPWPTSITNGSSSFLRPETTTKLDLFRSTYAGIFSTINETDLLPTAALTLPLGFLTRQSNPALAENLLRLLVSFSYKRSASILTIFHPIRPLGFLCQQSLLHGVQVVKSFSLMSFKAVTEDS